MHTVWNTILQSEEPKIDGDVVDKLQYRPNQPATGEPTMHCMPKGIKGKRHQECSYVGALDQKKHGWNKKKQIHKRLKQAARRD
jgi:hypothetical protein